jgi:hypothetical protein
MKPEHQVCTRGQAEELARRLGKYAPKSLWIWAVKVDIGGGRDGRVIILRKDEEAWHRDVFPAYTCAELGVMLPNCLVDEDDGHTEPLYRRQETDDYGDTSIFYSADGAVDLTELHYLRKSRFEAQAKADQLIELLREKLINPEDVKL